MGFMKFTARLLAHPEVLFCLMHFRIIQYALSFLVRVIFLPKVKSPRQILHVAANLDTACAHSAIRKAPPRLSCDRSSLVVHPPTCCRGASVAEAATGRNRAGLCFPRH